MTLPLKQASHHERNHRLGGSSLQRRVLLESDVVVSMIAVLYCKPGGRVEEFRTAGQPICESFVRASADVDSCMCTCALD